MQFVEHDAAQRAEQIGRVGAGQQQRQLLRRGQQDVGRIAALALALRGRRVAGAGLDADRQTHLGDRRFQIARDVDRQRLQRRDVERVQAAGAPQIVAGGEELLALPLAPKPSPLAGEGGRAEGEDRVRGQFLRCGKYPSPGSPPFGSPPSPARGEGDGASGGGFVPR